MSMGIIESGEYNKVAGLGGDAGEGNTIESHTLLAASLADGVATTVAQVTIPKGKWLILGQLHTKPFPVSDNFLTLAISTNGTAAEGEVVDQRRQVQGIWGFVQGMMFVDSITGPITIKLVGVANGGVSVAVIKAEIAAIKIPD